MTDRIEIGDLQVAKVLYDFINDEALPGTDIDREGFWAAVVEILGDLAPQENQSAAGHDTLAEVVVEVLLGVRLLRIERTDALVSHGVRRFLVTDGVGGGVGLEGIMPRRWPGRWPRSLPRRG